MATLSPRNSLGGFSRGSLGQAHRPLYPTQQASNAMAAPKPAASPGGRLVAGPTGGMVWQRDQITPTASNPMAAPKPAATPGVPAAPAAPLDSTISPLGMPSSYGASNSGANSYGSSNSNSPLNDPTAGLGRPLDAPISPLGMPSSYGASNSGANSYGSSNSNSPLNDPTAGLGRPLEFGGYRAEGGPVMPGRAYIVGERGPELIVPQMPGQVVPNGGSPQKPIPINPLDAKIAPMNQRADQSLQQSAQEYAQMSAEAAERAKYWMGNALENQEKRNQFKQDTPEFAAAQREVEKNWDEYADNYESAETEANRSQELRSFVGTGQGWKDHVAIDRWSQQNAEAAMADMRAKREQRPGGANFMEPMPLPSNQALPPNQRLLAAQRDNAAMAQNQRDLEAKSSPLTQASTPSMPFGMRPPANGSRIAQSPMNRPYAEMPGGSGSLANRPVRQIGRSANDPTRIAEQMRRRGDPRAIMQLGQMQMGQDFARERDAVNFAQGQQMFGQQQQAMDARDARNFEQGKEMFGMQQGAMEARDAANFMQQQQLEEARRAAEMAAQQAEIERRQQYGLKPLTVPGTNTPFFQDAKGSIYTGSALPSQEPLSFAPVPGTDLMMPRGQGADRLPMMQNRGTPGQPNLQPVGPSGSQKPAAMPKFQTDDQGRYFWFEPNGQGGFRRKFVDADGDGKPDVAPGAGSAQPALASGAVPKGTTAKGAAWSLFQP